MSAFITARKEGNCAGRMRRGRERGGGFSFFCVRNEKTLDKQAVCAYNVKRLGKTNLFFETAVSVN